MRDDRCGYVPEVTGYPGRGRVCCWRPVYENHDRCLWHANAEDKSVRDPGPLAPGPGERLDGAVFRGLSLQGVSWPSDCVLVGSDFSNTDVRNVDFSGADLRKSTFADSTATNATFRGANMEEATVTDTDLRDVDMRDVRLDQANLASSRINENTAFGDRVAYETDMWGVGDVNRQRDLLESAIRTYRCLEDLCQANTFYGRASRFYRKGKDLRRRYNWHRNNYGSALLAELSRWFTGYGNVPMRVIYTSLGVILLCGLVYPFLGRLQATSRDAVFTLTPGGGGSVEYLVTVFVESLYFSTVTFTTLGYGDLRPVGAAAQYLASVEALLGSILMALLVGVLTRSAWLR